MLYVVRWSYFAGVACALVAVVWRGMMTLGYFVPDYISMGRTLYDMSFYKGSLLFLVISIAAANYGDFSEKHRAAFVRSREMLAE